jgi:putative DNA primase/helicase
MNNKNNSAQEICDDEIYKTKTEAENSAIVKYDFDCVAIKYGRVWKLEPAPKNDAELLQLALKKQAAETQSELLENAEPTDNEPPIDSRQSENDATVEPEPTKKKVWRQKTLVNGVIDTNAQLDPESFPHRTENGRIKATVANLEHLFKSYGITCKYDEILKKQVVSMTKNTENDLSETSTYSQIKSLLSLNNAPISCIDLIPALMEQTCTNPIIDFITSKKWNKKHDYIGDLLKTLTVDPTDEAYKAKAVVTWLIQCVAAADSARSTPIPHAKAKFELVLVLQGGQGLKKTSWFQSLVPREFENYVIDGAHLDPSDKDTVIKCISGWICELGELDATFRKADIARLKAFLSNQFDMIRLPYERVASNFRRRTSFCASVNPCDFLTDSTGARRFLPLAITGCDYLHNVDMQQLWAQVWELYIGGQQWWCTDELEKMLESRHEKHSEVNPIVELINDKFDMEKTQRLETSQHLSITRILANCGIPTPTKTQINNAKDYLKKCGIFDSKTNGVKGYWVNFL